MNRYFQLRNTAWFFVLCGVLLTVFSTGCGDDGPGSPPGGSGTPSTAAEFTAQGWALFETGHYDQALVSFDHALNLDAGHGPALTGKGWTRLQQATSPTDMFIAAQTFISATNNGDSSADVSAGLASSYLGAGGSTALVDAISAAQAALTLRPGYSFSHRPSFDKNDLLLIQAFARAAQNNFSEALLLANQVTPSGISPTDSATWIIGGVAYPSFVTAVLAHLQTLSEATAG